MSIVLARRACALLAVCALTVTGCTSDGHKTATKAPATTTSAAAPTRAHTAKAKRTGSELLFVVQGHDATAAANSGTGWRLTVAVGASGT